MAEPVRIDTAEAVWRLEEGISDQELSQYKGPHIEFLTKRELAVSLLYTAFCTGALTAWAREPGSTAAPVQLISKEWETAVFWRDIIIGGRVRSAIGDRLAPYDGRDVLVEVSAFETWLGQRPKPQPPSSRDAECQAWLKAAMRASPHQRPMTRDEFSKEARDKFGVTNRHFTQVIWPNALINTGANWDKPGRPKNQKSNRDASPKS
jgi:hypothetical protein